MATAAHAVALLTTANCPQLSTVNSQLSSTRVRVLLVVRRVRTRTLYSTCALVWDLSVHVRAVYEYCVHSSAYRSRIRDHVPFPTGSSALRAHAVTLGPVTRKRAPMSISLVGELFCNSCLLSRSANEFTVCSCTHELHVLVYVRLRCVHRR